MKQLMKLMKGFAVFLFFQLAIYGPVNGAEKVDEGTLNKLVENNKWWMKWAGCMGGSCVTYWDWKGDGSVCARIIGAKIDEKCADKGPWRLEKNHLCWELEWYGNGGGFRKTCVFVETSGHGKFTAKRVKGFGSPFFTFSVVGPLTR